MGLELKKTKLVIKAALSESTLVCAISTPKLTIGDWTGTHDFIFADIRETAILGHNFLSKHNANFDFARDKLTVRDKGVTFNLNYINDVKQDGNEELEPKVVKSILKESEPIETNMCFKECLAYSVADQIIKANTEALVTVKADTMSKPSDVIMFEPYKADELSL